MSSPARFTHANHVNTEGGDGGGSGGDGGSGGGGDDESGGGGGDSNQGDAVAEAVLAMTVAVDWSGPCADNFISSASHLLKVRRHGPVWKLWANALSARARCPTHRMLTSAATILRIVITSSL